METEQLEKKLGSQEEFDENLIQENACPEVGELIAEYMARKGLSRADLIRRMNIDRNYGYQLLNGTRKPTREHIIQIGLLLELDINRFQRLLKAARKKPLYVRDMFDAKVYYAVKHKMGYEKAVEFIGANIKNKRA